MSSKFDQFQAWNVELAALDQLKKSFTLETIQNILMTCWLSGERSLPFGLLVIIIEPRHEKPCFSNSKYALICGCTAWVVSEASKIGLLMTRLNNYHVCVSFCMPACLSACFGAFGVPSGAILYNYFYQHFLCLFACLFCGLWRPIWRFSVYLCSIGRQVYMGYCPCNGNFTRFRNFQQDYKAVVKNEKELNSDCTDCCRGPDEEHEVNNRMTRAFLKQSCCSSNRKLSVDIKLRLGIEIKKIISHNAYVECCNVYPESAMHFLSYICLWIAPVPVHCFSITFISRFFQLLRRFAQSQYDF